MKLAAQLWTIRNFTKTEEDIKKSLQKIKDIGYNAVQVSGFGPFRPEWLAETVKEIGLEICVTHTPFERIVNETDAVIAEHKLYGCDTIGLGSMMGEYDREKVEAKFDALAPAIEKIHAAGMSFVFHNHWQEFVPYKEDGKTVFDIYCERFPADRAGILLDFYWVVYACEDPIKQIEKYADRFGIVHFKDMRMNEKGDRVFSEIYNGCIDYTAIYNKLAEKGGRWVAVEEDECPEGLDPFDALAISLQNIKEHGLAFENL